jgi:hypothetical protein
MGLGVKTIFVGVKWGRSEALAGAVVKVGSFEQ